MLYSDLIRLKSESSTAYEVAARIVFESVVFTAFAVTWTVQRPAGLVSSDYSGGGDGVLGFLDAICCIRLAKRLAQDFVCIRLRAATKSMPLTAS